MGFNGGYYLIDNPMITAGHNGHTAANPEGLSSTTMGALNIIQATPWRINRYLLYIIEESRRTRFTLAGLPDSENAPLPKRLPDEEWQAMSDKDRSDHKYLLSKVHSDNAKMASKREALQRKINVAQAYADRPRIYFPCFIDFRTRIYPYPQDLNFQGDDVAKSLLEFANGVPLGERGFYWLTVSIANAAGHDKLTFPERIKWVESNKAAILDSVDNPFDGARFWCDADEPHCFLAKAYEWAAAIRSGSPYAYVSHQPIPHDGTANGLQHLSLLGLDRLGATVTNCSASNIRYDLYTEVAERTKAIIAEDATRGLEEAHAWIEQGVTRKTVKRACMTTPYGVTNRGIRDQLISDGFLKDIKGNKGKCASYMTGTILKALDGTIMSARAIMGYFQGVASVLADSNIPLRWVTPAGSEIWQTYYEEKTQQISTTCGRVRLFKPTKEGQLSRRKQALAASPNIIHSFDAAHLQLTVCALYEAGVKDFCMVHDSYAVHAAYVDAMAHNTRATAISVYEQDQLGMFHEYVMSYAGDVTLPQIPAKGDFNVSELAYAPYFFG